MPSPANAPCCHRTIGGSPRHTALARCASRKLRLRLWNLGSIGRAIPVRAGSAHPAAPANFEPAPSGFRRLPRHSSLSPAVTPRNATHSKPLCNRTMRGKPYEKLIGYIHLLTLHCRSAKFPTRQVVRSSDQFSTVPLRDPLFGFQGQGFWDFLLDPH